MDPVTEYKYLGIVLDEKLSFVSYKRGSFNPVLDQDSIFYIAYNSEYLNSLQSLQNKLCLRLLYNNDNWPGTVIAHNQSKLLNVILAEGS